MVAIMAPPTSSITDNSVLLTLFLGRLGNTKRVDPGMVEVDADKDAIKVGKELLDSEELEAIKSFDGKIRVWLYGKALPAGGYLRSGVHRLPVTLVLEVDTKLQEFKQERRALVSVFLETYKERAEAARGRLRALFNEADYPPLDKVTSTFIFDWSYLTFGVPDGLQSISAQLYAREQKKAEMVVRSEVEEIRTALRTGFAELLDHAVQRLSVTEKGKKVIFRDSLITNMTEFFKYFNDRNIIGDGDLSRVVEQARAVMSGIKPDELRRDDILRDSVREKLAAVRQAMDDALVVKPSRRILLEDV